jgi:hypothetical protein
MNELHRIYEFVELKVYIDIFNERGHKGFKEPINPFLYCNHKCVGMVNSNVHAYMWDGFVIILEMLDLFNVQNMLIFALEPQKNILSKVVDICRDYGTINYNSDFRNRYYYITKKFDGLQWSKSGKYYYSANGRDYERRQNSNRSI